MEDKKRVIITGGGGQDARLLLEYLSDSNEYEIHYVGGEIADNVKAHYTLDLSLRKASYLLAYLRPDYWFNFAALSSPKQSCDDPIKTLHINTMGVAYQLQAIKEYAPLCRYFNAGSILETDQYGSVFDPKTPYAISKLAAHQILNFYRQQGLYAVQGILGLHESKLREGDFLFKRIVTEAKQIAVALEKQEKFEPISVYNPNSLINTSLAKDVVEIIWQSMQWDNPEDFIIQSSCPIYLREFIEKTFEKLNIDCYWSGDNLIIPDYIWNDLKPKSGVLARVENNEPPKPKSLRVPLNRYWTDSSIDKIISELV